MRKNKIILFLYLVIFIGVYFVFKGQQEKLFLFFEIGSSDILTLLLLNSATMYAWTILQKKILAKYGLQQTTSEWVGLAFIAAFYNLIIPGKGGSVFRSVYLKRKYNFLYIKFVAYLFRQSLYVGIVSSFMFGVVLIFLESSLQMSVWLIVPGLLAMLFAVFVYKVTKVAGNRWSKKKFISKYLKYLEINENIKDNFWNSAGIIVILLCLKSISLYISFRAIHYHVPFMNSFLISTVIMFTNLVSVVPGNIGIRELIIGFGLKFFGYSMPLVVMASVIERAATVIVVVIGALVCKYLLLKENINEFS